MCCSVFSTADASVRTLRLGLAVVNFLRKLRISQLEFTVDPAMRPWNIGLSSDARRLGVSKTKE
jgi:hypothetical protein